MQTLLTTGDQVIVVSREFQVVKLDIIDVDVRREREDSLTAIYWLSDGKAYQRTDLFTNKEEARQYCQHFFQNLLANLER